MNLCVDVGNSTIVFATYLDEELTNKVKIKTRLNWSESELALSIKSMFKENGIEINSIESIILSSVVPSINHTIVSALSSVFSLPVMTISSGVKTGVEIKIDNPAEIGNDLIADLAAAKKIYSYPTLVVDLGTASKILCLDKNGAFISGLIMPGLVSGASLLKSSTDLLPEVGLYKPTDFLAKNTYQSINNGIIYGHVEMIKGLVKRYEETLGYSFRVVVTGGCANLLIDLLPSDYIYDEDLVLRGLNIILEKNK